MATTLAATSAWAGARVVMLADSSMWELLLVDLAWARSELVCRDEVLQGRKVSRGKQLTPLCVLRVYICVFYMLQQSNFGGKNEVCGDFLKGRCTRGETCRFSHDKGQGPPCRDFLKGLCTRGDQCRYSHYDAARSVQQPRNRVQFGAD
jgi:hypothetical protein